MEQLLEMEVLDGFGDFWLGISLKIIEYWSINGFPIATFKITGWDELTIYLVRLSENRVPPKFDGLIIFPCFPWLNITSRGRELVTSSVPRDRWSHLPKWTSNGKVMFFLVIFPKLRTERLGRFPSWTTFFEVAAAASGSHSRSRSRRRTLSAVKRHLDETLQK